MQLYPFTFSPVFKERIWGGRRLVSLYGKHLPDGKAIGESWEICDRPEETSVILNGRAAGKSLRWLMENHGRQVVGDEFIDGSRFPLLVKLLDAEEDLSLQVHPPSSAAKALQGESKTEFWYVANARTGACLHAGLKRGVTPDEFERRARDGSVQGVFHRHEVRAGDAMFLPSGRVHALGAGTVVFEIQENSDTTYRVFDWNRVDASGKPRELHLEKAMAAIQFDDFEPDLLSVDWMATTDGSEFRELVKDPLFQIQQFRVGASAVYARQHGNRMAICGVITGQVMVYGGGEVLRLEAGQFGLLPKELANGRIVGQQASEFLLVEFPGTC